MKNYISLPVICLIAAVLLSPQFASAQLTGSFGFQLNSAAPQGTSTIGPPTIIYCGWSTNPVGQEHARPENICGSSVAHPKFLGATIPVLFVSAGLFVFDGAGHVTVTDSVSVNGTITRFETYTGTYTLNANGTGSLTLHSGTLGVPVNFDFELVQSGTKLLLVGTDSGISVNGFAVKL